MSYLEYYGFTQEPFSNAPVSKFYFDSRQHGEAIVRLRHVVDRMKGLALLVGNIGAGKTTLARKMLDSLPEDKFEAALLVIIHSGISANWLLKRIAVQLGVEKPADEKLALLSQLYRRLLQIHQQGRKAVVLIDEAQMLNSREIMEEFRGLLNLEIPETKLITFVFFGLPEIEENLKLDPPLLQRVALKYRLKSLNLDSTKKYVTHRLRLAGAKEPVFTEKAIEHIHHHSKGIPRVINTICDNVLFEGFMLRQKQIDASVVDPIAEGLALAIDEDPIQETAAPTAGVVRRESPSSHENPIFDHQLTPTAESVLGAPTSKSAGQEPTIFESIKQQVEEKNDNPVHESFEPAGQTTGADLMGGDMIDLKIDLEDENTDNIKSVGESSFERSESSDADDGADIDSLLEGLVEKS